MPSATEEETACSMCTERINEALISFGFPDARIMVRDRTKNRAMVKNAQVLHQPSTSGDYGFSTQVRMGIAISIVLVVVAELV